MNTAKKSIFQIFLYAVLFVASILYAMYWMFYGFPSGNWSDIPTVGILYLIAFGVFWLYIFSKVIILMVKRVIALYRPPK